MQTNIIKRGSSLFFFIKGQEGCYFFNDKEQAIQGEQGGAIHSMKGQAGRSTLLKLSGGNSAIPLKSK